MLAWEARLRNRISKILVGSVLCALSVPALAQDEDQTVFRVPLERVTPAPTLDPVFMWSENTSACSTTCGSGTRTVSFQCQNAANPDTILGGFGPPEPDAQCVSAIGPKPSGSTTACVSYSGCTFDWVKPPESVTVIPIDPNPPGRPGCGQVRRAFDPHCERTDGTVMADSDHAFCRNDRPDYNDVAAGVADALGYDRTAVETNACNATDHEWVLGAWGPWSSTCSTSAVHTRAVTCKRKFDGALVADSECPAPKPATSEAQAVYSSCSYAAEFGSWGAWSSECSATSTRSRSVQCRRSNGDIVATSECSSRGVAITPTSETQARYGSCTYSRVNPGSWSSWSSTCSASASRSRTYQCRRSDGSIVADSECTSRGISLSESDSQAVYSGCSYNWQTGGWSGWSSGCSASATRTRSVTCRRDPVGETVSDSYCTAAKPATSEVSAQYGSCSYSPVNWSGWSAWSSTCSASATRTQSAQCLRSDGSIVAASECTSRGIALTQSETAAVYHGCASDWVVGGWSGWSSTCSASAARTRSVYCRRSDGTTVPDASCPTAKPATSEVSGQYGGCSYYATNWSGWGSWSSVCSASATRTQTAQCARSDGSIVAASECTSRGIALSQSETGANYSGCSYSVSFGAWSGWSSSCSASATRTRSATCYRSDGAAVSASECTGRGIAMTPTSEVSAQYGGCTFSPGYGSWSSCPTGSGQSQSSSMTSCTRSDGAAVATSYCTSAGHPANNTRPCVFNPGGLPAGTRLGTYSNNVCSNSQHTTTTNYGYGFGDPARCATGSMHLQRKCSDGTTNYATCPLAPWQNGGQGFPTGYPCDGVCD